MAGHLDGACFFRSFAQPGGFLEVQGWFCAIGQENLALSADLRVGDSVARIRCRDPRPDVAAANAAFSLNCGFNVIIPIAADLHPDLQFTIEFSAERKHYGGLVGRICHPELEIERHGGALSELRLKKLRNLVVNERERLSRTECITSMPVTGQIDPAFLCNLECPLCLSEMARRDGYNMPIMKEAELDHILTAYGDYLIRIWLSLWGEPLLDKRLPELIAKCKSREI